MSNELAPCTFKPRLKKSPLRAQRPSRTPEEFFRDNVARFLKRKQDKVLSIKKAFEEKA